MTFDKRIFDAIHESVQIWNKEGKKLFCNNKAAKLYKLNDDEIKTIEDVLKKWNFYDQTNTQLTIEELPAFKVLQSKESINETILNMVSDEESKWLKTSAKPILDANGEVDYIVTTCLDITHFKNKELKYKKIANYDPLTGLPNRLLLSDRLNLAINHALRTNTSMAVCMIDLDGFKALNDTYGHKAGDNLLIEVARRMKEVVRSDDTVARLGGDEFVIILSELQKSEDCAVTLYRLLNTIASTYVIDGNSVETISASIGVTVYPEDKVDSEVLLRHADVAMYKSKNSGKNKFCFFDMASDQKIKANYKALNKIKTALQNGDFSLYYQPKLNSATGQIVEVEALARWNHPLFGIMQPDEFLPLIDNDNELCDMFDNWVIHKAIKQLLIWQNKKLFVKICINISSKQFKEKYFIQKIIELFRYHGVGLELLSYLEFEILEKYLIENLIHSNEIIKKGKTLGLTFALDNYGTSYSSLMHLKELHIGTIKINKDFVSNMLENSDNMAIVQAVTALASAFDISVSAQGAENIEQVMSLLQMGCDEIQGFAIAKPMPPSEVFDFILDFSPDPRWKLIAHTLPSKIDFELLLAESNHKNWLEVIIGELSKENPNCGLIELDHTKCKFGKWFEKNKNKNDINLTSFKKLDIIHQKIHHFVEKFFKTTQEEPRAINKNELEILNSMSIELVEMLDVIRHEVEKTKQQHSVVNKILQKRQKYAK